VTRLRPSADTAAVDEEMSVGHWEVFILNSIALLIFPSIGAGLELSHRNSDCGSGGDP